MHSTIMQKISKYNQKGLLPHEIYPKINPAGDGALCRLRARCDLRAHRPAGQNLSHLH